MKNNLKELRKEQQFTQQEFAERLNVSRQTIISIETGKYDPSLTLAFKIAYLLHVKIEEIFEPDPNELQ